MLALALALRLYWRLCWRYSWHSDCPGAGAHATCADTADGAPLALLLALHAEAPLALVLTLVVRCYWRSVYAAPGAPPAPFLALTLTLTLLLALTFVIWALALLLALH